MEFILPAVISFLITVTFMFPVIFLAKKFNLVDNPKLRPHPAHIQKRIVPRAGGVAPFLGIIFAILIFIPLTETIVGIIFALLILLLVGLLDDKYQNISPYLRLGSQFIAAAIIVVSGVSINFITNPLGGIIYLNTINFTFSFLGLNQLILLSDILAIIWIIWVMNMINWSKGVDGQMPSITTVASIILGLLSIKLNLLGDFNQANTAKIAFATAGSSFGLLIFNWYPAKIFPAFSGSTVLGFMVAVLSILSGAKLATAILVLLIPATDFAYIFFRRIIQGKSPVWGDRGHLHHKLLDLGLSHQQISLFYAFGSVILGLIALNLSSSGKLFALVLMAIVILGAILWLNFFGALSKRHAPDNG